MLRRLTIANTLTIVLWLLLPVIGARVQTDTDMWWQLRSGELNLSQGRIVQEETFSYTCSDGQCPTRLQHEWLGQPVLVAFWKLLGYPGLTFYALTFAMIGMAFLYVSMSGGPYLKAFTMALFAFAASIFWGARPLMLSFALAAVTIWIVYGYHRHGIVRRLWLLPPMFALWGNLHGGWPQGALILIAAAAGMALNLLIFRRTLPHGPSVVDPPVNPPAEPPANGWTPGIRKIGYFLVPCILAAVLLPLINPYGTAMLRVPFDTIGFDFQPLYIEEWRAPLLVRTEMLPFFVLLALTALAMLIDWRHADFVEILMVGGTAYMALGAARHIAFFATVALVPLSIHAVNIGAARGWHIRMTTRVTPMVGRLNLLIIAMIGLTSLMYLTFLVLPKNYDGVLRARLPVAAVEEMERIQAPQRIFNSWNWGGYLIYFAPEYPVYIDGRADLYRAFTWTFFDLWQAKDGWREAFAKWDINTVLVEPRAPLVDVLRAEPGWSVAYEDGVAVLLIKSDDTQ